VQLVICKFCFYEVLISKQEVLERNNCQFASYDTDRIENYKFSGSSIILCVVFAAIKILPNICRVTKGDIHTVPGWRY
jgi:hypothetical protein